MRLFIAVNFKEKIKLKLIEAQEKLKKHAVYGNFSAPENLHLTLVFLGEIEDSKLNGIKNAMDKIKMKPFKICVSKTGSFKNESGDIWWMGIDNPQNLIKIQKELLINLMSAGFDFPRNRFSPHITFARQVSLRNDFNYEAFNNALGNAYTQVSKISLMQSLRPDGKLTYTEIYFKELL